MELRYYGVFPKASTAIGDAAALFPDKAEADRWCRANKAMSHDVKVVEISMKLDVDVTPL